MHAAPRVHVSRRGSIDIEMPRGAGVDEAAAHGDTATSARSASAAYPSPTAVTSAPSGSATHSQSGTRSPDSDRYDRAVAVVQRALQVGDNAPAPLRPGSAEDQAHGLAQQVLAALDGIASRTVEDEQYVHAIRTAFVLISAGYVRPRSQPPPITSASSPRRRSAASLCLPRSVHHPTPSTHVHYSHSVIVLAAHPLTSPPPSPPSWRL